MILTEIKATTIPDAWFQCLSKVQEVGFKYTVERGSFEGDTRLEFDWITILITHPYSEPYDSMLPDIPPQLGIPNPVENGYVEQYIPYLMSEVIQKDEQYTYGSLIGSQRDFWIDILKKTPRSNQAILQVGAPGHEYLSHSPCLRHIDMRVKDGELIFYPYFRSWDLWGGFPANLAGIAVLQKYMADEMRVSQGPICASSKGLHIYGYVEELAKLRCYK
jgi:thymidylate synthase